MEESTLVSKKYFQTADYAVYAIVLSISLIIGGIFSYRGRKKNTTDEYLMGSRKLSLLPVGISICVSVVSSNTILGAPADMYSFGIMYWFTIIPLIIVAIVLPLWFVPFIYQLKLTSFNKVSLNVYWNLERLMLVL